MTDVEALSSIWSPRDAPKILVSSDRLRLFALQATVNLGRAIAGALGQTLAAHEEREFEDGEHKVRPLAAVGGMDVYVIQSLHSGPSRVPTTSYVGCCSSSER